MKKLNKNMLALSLLCANLAAIPGCGSGVCTSVQRFFAPQSSFMAQTVAQTKLKNGATLNPDFLEHGTIPVFEIDLAAESVRGMFISRNGPETSSNKLYVMPDDWHTYYNYNGSKAGYLLTILPDPRGRVVNQMLDRLLRNSTSLEKQILRNLLRDLAPNSSPYKNHTPEGLMYHLYSPFFVKPTSHNDEAYVETNYGTFTLGVLEDFDKKDFTFGLISATENNQQTVRTIYPIIAKPDGTLSLIQSDAESNLLTKGQKAANLAALLAVRSMWFEGNRYLMPLRR